MSDKRGFTYQEAADYLGTSETRIKRLAASNEIPVKYLGSSVLIDRNDLDTFFDALPSERA